MKKILFGLLFILSINSISSQEITFNEPTVRFIISAGVDYNFPISTDYITQTETLSIDVPLNFCFDIRYINWFSIYTGIEFYYGLHIYSRVYNDVNYTYNINSFIMRFPLMIKFYPMYDKDAVYSNFYIGIGGFLHIWPVNMYYVTSSEGTIHSGNCYYPVHEEMPPGKIYTPVNVGTRFAIGNQFYITNKILLGLEMYVNYLFIPYINGYYYNLNYNQGNGVILDFNASIGIDISIGIDLNASNY